MRHLFLTLLLILPLFLAPVVVLGADPKPKAAGTDQPTGGDKAGQQPAADQAPSDPKADSDADKADADKADPIRPTPTSPNRERQGSRPTSMDIIPEPGGLKTLTIHFRWSLYPNSSIEVRLVPGPPNPKGVTASPIYFSEQLKGTVHEALYTCLDHPGEGGRTHSFTKDKIVYKMIGRRNSLGNQGVHVQVHPEDSDTLQRSPPKPLPPGARVQAHPHLLEDINDPDPNPAAAYLQLDTWAVDQGTLSLDLAGMSLPSRARSSFGSFAATRSFGKSRFAGRDTSNRLRQRPVRLVEIAGVHPGIAFHDQDVERISRLPGGGRFAAGTQSGHSRRNRRQTGDVPLEHIERGSPAVAGQIVGHRRTAQKLLDISPANVLAISRLMSRLRGNSAGGGLCETNGPKG